MSKFLFLLPLCFYPFATASVEKERKFFKLKKFPPQDLPKDDPPHPVPPTPAIMAVSLLGAEFSDLMVQWSPLQIFHGGKWHLLVAQGGRPVGPIESDRLPGVLEGSEKSETGTEEEIHVESFYLSFDLNSHFPRVNNHTVTEENLNQKNQTIVQLWISHVVPANNDLAVNSHYYVFSQIFPANSPLKNTNFKKLDTHKDFEDQNPVPMLQFPTFLNERIPGPPPLTPDTPAQQSLPSEGSETEIQLPEPLNHFAWEGEHIKNQWFGVGNVPQNDTFYGYTANGPLILFENGTTASSSASSSSISAAPSQTLVVSHANHFKNAIVHGLNTSNAPPLPPPSKSPIYNAFAYGLSSELLEIPAGTIYRTFLAANDGRFQARAGVRETMYKWGRMLEILVPSKAKRPKVKRSSLLEEDVILNKLGFWTDNGAQLYGDSYNSKGNYANRTDRDRATREYNLTCCTGGEIQEVMEKLKSSNSDSDSDSGEKKSFQTQEEQEKSSTRQTLQRREERSLSVSEVSHSKEEEKHVNKKRHANKRFHYLQLDDWWYVGVMPVNQSWGIKCVEDWEVPEKYRKGKGMYIPGHDLFPTDLKLMLYAPYFCGNATYLSRNDSGFANVSWVRTISDTVATPGGSYRDSYRFFSALFREMRQKRPSFSNFEIDFTDDLFLFSKRYRQELDLFEDYLLGLNDAAAELSMGEAETLSKSPLFLQFCMVLPSDVLFAGLHLPFVTNARASDDYSAVTNFDITSKSLFFNSVSQLRASKDNFWTTSTRPDKKKWPVYTGFYGDVGKNIQLNAILAATSLGPVGPSDREWLDDFGVIRRATRCCQDGVLLQPEEPLVLVDEMFEFKNRELRVSFARMGANVADSIAYLLLETSAPGVSVEREEEMLSGAQGPDGEKGLHEIQGDGGVISEEVKAEDAAFPPLPKFEVVNRRKVENSAEMSGTSGTSQNSIGTFFTWQQFDSLGEKSSPVDRLLKVTLETHARNPKIVDDKWFEYYALYRYGDNQKLLFLGELEKYVPLSKQRAFRVVGDSKNDSETPSAMEMLLGPSETTHVFYYRDGSHKLDRVAVKNADVHAERRVRFHLDVEGGEAVGGGNDLEVEEIFA